MYTLLLVDDEEEVTRIIAKKVKWNDLGFSVTGHANNGLKALEMLEEMQPDVVMTDIRMPYMDGLELCGQIREKYPATKLVLFTGFDDFEYAKEAVHLEIEEYVLKPLNAAEITKVFEDLKKKLDQEINEKKSAELLKKYYKDSLPLLQANFYSTLIEGRVPEEELTKYLANYQIDFTGPLYGCVLIHASKTQVPKDMDPQLVAISVDKQAGERLEQKWKAKRFNYLGDTVMIVQLESEKEVSELTDSCDRFCKYVHHMIGAVVTVGVGQICDNISDLVKSYQSAREAVSYRVLYGTKRAINIGEIVPKEQIKPVQSEESRMQTLFRAIRIGDSAEIERAAHGEMEKLHKNTETMSQYNLATMEIVSGFFKFCTDNSLDFNKISGNMQNIYEKVSQMDESSLTAWIVQMSETISEKLKCARNSSARRLIVEAQNIVQERYMEADISLDEVCAVLGVSNSYFSSVFKKEAGKSFISYLTDYRMDIAAEMILNTDEKSETRAEKVGYLDANYFSYVFKKKFGVSPSKYRASVK